MEDNMNFKEFRKLWEIYCDMHKYFELLWTKRLDRAKFEEMKKLPLDKIFNVDTYILSKNIYRFFENNFNIQTITLDYPEQHLYFSFADGSNRLDLGRLVDKGSNISHEYDLRRLLGGLDEPYKEPSSDIQKFMSYEGIRDVLWKTIKENYNSEKKKEIGLIRKRVNENLKTIEKINAPDYVKNTTADLNSEIDADNQKLQQILDTLDTID